MFSNVTRHKYYLVGNLNENSNSDDENEQNDPNGKSKPYFNIEYNNKMIGKSRPKDLTINLVVGGSQSEIRSFNNNENDGGSLSRRKQQYVHLMTKKAEWDLETKTYTLDFKGRAEEPSTNNLQIVDESSKQNVLLQLGKMSSKCYSLDYTYPFNAFSAFGLAVSCLSRN